MITLQGMRLNQKGHILYLTSATVEEIKKWFDAGNIYADIWKREKEEGYQRAPDAKRYKEIAKYLEGGLGIAETLLPSSLILNIRQKGTIEFKAFEKSKSKETIESGEILIDDAAMPFCQVDGQHRVRGLIEAYKDLKERQPADFEEIRSYPVPLTIIEVDRPTEAIQFVVINSTQRKVEPNLVLRILAKRYRDKSEELEEFFLRGKTWRIWAVEVCDGLNLSPDPSWCDRIIAPGDERKGRVISEQNFVNTLETVYSKIDRDAIKSYLPLYWKAISSLWTDCIGENAVRYSLQRTNGTSVFHWLFPFVYFKSKSLGGVKLKTFIDILKPVSKKLPPSFWIRGGEAKLYTSRGSQQELVDRMIAYTLPKGKMFKLGTLDPKLEDTKEAKTWQAAEKLIPLRLYHFFDQNKLNGIDANATGVYVFYSFTKQNFYVGRSQKGDLKSRLQKHLQNKESEFHIFNYRLCKEPKEAHDLECALFHLFPHDQLINKEHPSAFEGRKCPFCATLALV